MCCVVQFLCMLQVFSLFVVIIVEVIAQKKELLHILHRALFLRVMHYGVIFIIQFMALPVELKHAVSSLTSNSINLQATAPHTNTSPCPDEDTRDLSLSIQVNFKYSQGSKPNNIFHIDICNLNYGIKNYFVLLEDFLILIKGQFCAVEKRTRCFDGVDFI